MEPGLYSLLPTVLMVQGLFGALHCTSTFQQQLHYAELLVFHNTLATLWSPAAWIPPRTLLSCPENIAISLLAGRRLFTTPSGICRRVDLVRTDVSEEHVASIFRVQKVCNQPTANVFSSPTLFQLVW
jgi:hypothetical protein